MEGGRLSSVHLYTLYGQEVRGVHYKHTNKHIYIYIYEYTVIYILYTQLKSEVYIHLSQIHLNSVSQFLTFDLVKSPCFRSVRITTLFSECEMSE